MRSIHNFDILNRGHDSLKEEIELLKKSLLYTNENFSNIDLLECKRVLNYIFYDFNISKQLIDYAENRRGIHEVEGKFYIKEKSNFKRKH